MKTLTTKTGFGPVHVVKLLSLLCSGSFAPGLYCRPCSASKLPVLASSTFRLATPETPKLLLLDHQPATKVTKLLHQRPLSKRSVVLILEPRPEKTHIGLFESTHDDRHVMMTHGVSIGRLPVQLSVLPRGPKNVQRYQRFYGLGFTCRGTLNQS